MDNRPVLVTILSVSDRVVTTENNTNNPTPDRNSPVLGETKFLISYVHCSPSERGTPRLTWQKPE